MQANRCKHVCTFLIGYRSGGTPYILRNLRRVPDCGTLSEEAVPASDLPALRVACRYSPVGFDRQQGGNGTTSGGRAKDVSDNEEGVTAQTSCFIIDLSKIWPIIVYRL